MKYVPLHTWAYRLGVCAYGSMGVWEYGRIAWAHMATTEGQRVYHLNGSSASRYSICIVDAGRMRDYGNASEVISLVCQCDG